MKLSLNYAVLVLLILSFASCSQEALNDIDIPIAENDLAMEQELLGIVNVHRSSLGYTALQHSQVAYEYANEHNDYMIAKGSLSHDNFNIRASNISAEVNAESVAENIAKDYPSAILALEGWLNSTDHKETLEGDFTHTAVSVKKDATGNYYYTQLFFR